LFLYTASHTIYSVIVCKELPGHDHGVFLVGREYLFRTGIYNYGQLAMANQSLRALLHAKFLITAIILLWGCSTAQQTSSDSANKEIESTNRNAPKIQSEVGTYSSTEPMTRENLSGVWVPVQVFQQRRNRRTTLRRNLPTNVYQFNYKDEHTYSVQLIQPDGSAVFEPVDLTLREHRDQLSLRLASNSSSVRNRFPPFSVRPKRSSDGVDILTNVTTTTQNSDYLIRFRQTDGAKEANIAELTFDKFCTGPAAKLSQGVLKEQGALKALERDHPAQTQKYSLIKASSLGLFNPDLMTKVIGKPLNELSREAKSTIFERLRVCAIYHPDRNVGDALADALFGEQFTLNAVRSDIGRSLTSKSPLLPSRTKRSVEGWLEKAITSASAIASLPGYSDISALSEEELKSSLNTIEGFVYDIPPSQIGNRFTTVGRLGDQLKAVTQARIDNTSPARSDQELVLSASRKYLLENCNRAVLALRDKSGQALPGLLSASSVEPRGRMCVIESATHLFKFNVSRVSLDTCSSNEPTVCNFTAYWSCSYTLNPKFGFSSGTANIDPVCPLVRSSSVQMRGMYQRKAPSRWVATKVEW